MRVFYGGKSTVLPMHGNAKDLGKGLVEGIKKQLGLKSRANMNFLFPVDLSIDEGTILVKFPDIPEAITYGEDREEALMRAVDALETAFMTYVDDRKMIPKPSALRGRPGVSPCALSCSKLAIHQAMVQHGLRKTDLARRLGWHLPQVDRLLNLNHQTRMDHIEQALSSVGLNLVVEFKKAA